MSPKIRSTDTDIVVIGCGPAGLSALSWLAELGFRAAGLESAPAPGGQMHLIHNAITNYPGVRAENGREMLAKMYPESDVARFDIRRSASVVAFDAAALGVRLSDGSDISAKAVVIATGVSRRRLGIEGEEIFTGRGLMTSGVAEKGTARDRDVVVIGGGDAALENALILSETARKVTLVHRGSDFSARHEFVAGLRQRSNVDVIMRHNASAFVGGESLESVRITDAVTGAERSVTADLALVRIGVIPNSEPFAAQLDTDEKGYIRIDRDCRTSAPFVFAIGDVALPLSPTIAAAVGTGATAAKVIAYDLDKSR